MSPHTDINPFNMKGINEEIKQEEREDDDEIIFVRNPKFKMPPQIHDHHKRNAFHREFNRDSILMLEKDLQKELL